MVPRNQTSPSPLLCQKSNIEYRNMPTFKFPHICSSNDLIWTCSKLQFEISMSQTNHHYKVRKKRNERKQNENRNVLNHIMGSTWYTINYYLFTEQPLLVELESETCKKDNSSLDFSIFLVMNRYVISVPKCTLKEP